MFAPAAEVTGELPVNPVAAAAQRRRWEHGYLKVILSGVPRLVAAAVRRRLLDLFVLALEVAVPPLSALGIAADAALALLSGWAVFGGPVGLLVALAVASAVATAAVFAAWVRYGRGVLPVGTLLRVPVYAVRKIGLYLGFFVRPQREWVRTARQWCELWVSSRVNECCERRRVRSLTLSEIMLCQINFDEL